MSLNPLVNGISLNAKKCGDLVHRQKTIDHRAARWNCDACPEDPILKAFRAL
jgi:hypothetical protein